MINSLILLQAAGAPGADWSSMFMIIALVVIFYFFMIRPQQKKQKEIRKFREAIQPGDNVVTAGGIYGKVRRIKETTFVIEVAPNVQITVDKGSVYPSAQDATADPAAEQKTIKN